jgi:hypothetical protein
MKWLFKDREWFDIWFWGLKGGLYLILFLICILWLIVGLFVR